MKMIKKLLLFFTTCYLYLCLLIFLPCNYIIMQVRALKINTLGTTLVQKESSNLKQYVEVRLIESYQSRAGRKNRF